MTAVPWRKISKGEKMINRVVTIVILAASLLFALSTFHLMAGPGDPPLYLLPASGGVKGWVKDGEHISYLPDNLWEYINGSAERFLEYDFEQVLVQHYSDSEGGEIKVEIYDHGSPLDAFGIYSRLRSQDSDFLEIGNEAFGDGYSIHFWKGQFYVKVSAYDENNGRLDDFALHVAEKIEDPGSTPAETGLFDLGDYTGTNITYISKGVLGSGKLPPAFVGEYGVEQDSGKIFLFSLKDGDDGSAILDWCRQTGSGFDVAGTGKEGTVWAEGELPYRGRAIFFSYGKIAGLITGFRNSPKTADELGGRILEKVIAFAE